MSRTKVFKLVVEKVTGKIRMKNFKNMLMEEMQMLFFHIFCKGIIQNRKYGVRRRNQVKETYFEGTVDYE